MLQLLHDNQKAQKYLLGAFEILVGKSYPDQLMSKVPHILMSLYDNDLVEEEVFLQWGPKVSLCFDLYLFMNVVRRRL